MEIVVMSREIIKPSSPTPNHLRNLQMSLIDQQQLRNWYISHVYFYSAHGDAGRFEETKISDRLKKSLSETLTQFYPIAGRINSNEWIFDCNDDGLEYVVARVTGPLNHVLSSPKADLVIQLIPYTKLISAVQVSVFDCGGMAIGVTVTHEIGDVLSMATFINSWAAIARGAANETVLPTFGFASLFPPTGDLPTLSLAAVMGELSLPRFVTKRFVFNSSKLSALKAICAKHIHSPTRVEVVTALIFKCSIKAIKSSEPSAITIPLNLRTRMSPPLSCHSFGNLAFRVATPPWPTETEPELPFLVGQLRDTIRKIDGDYVEKLKADNAILLCQQFKEERHNMMKGGINALYFNINCRFPFYEADFGWGMPTWATQVIVEAPNVTLLDTDNGDGIEAWVTLAEEDMARFCSEQDLLDFACENPMIPSLLSSV